MKKGLNANQIKLIAILAMTVDHVTWILWPGCNKAWWILLLHAFGRITAPVMWYFIAEGYHHTRNLQRYVLRLSLFAVVSHFAYDFAFNIPFVPFTTGLLNQTSVILALLCGLLILVTLDSPSLPEWGKVLLVIGLCLVSFPADWSCIAALAIMGIGKNRESFAKQMFWMMAFVGMYAVVYFLFVDRLYAVLQLCTALSIPLLRSYNGRRGTFQGMKWLFYLYYPAHLALIGLLRLFTSGDLAVMIESLSN